MVDEQQSARAFQAFIEAKSDVLDPLVSSVKLLGLLRGASASGLLAAVRQPATPEGICAEIGGLREDQAIDICCALVAFSVLERTDDDRYQLSGQWMTLLAPDAVFRFEDVINNAFAESSALSNATAGTHDYWTVDSCERLALAKGVAFDPESPHSPGFMGMVIRGNHPEIHTILDAGGRYLELGCGAGGGLVSLLQAFPNSTAVGVDLALDLLDETSRRAKAVGVSKRLVLQAVDARKFEDPEGFDIVFWSQFFFPENSRAAAIDAAFQSLKPGVYLLAPLKEDPKILREQLYSPQGRSFSMSRIVYGEWGVPLGTGQDVQREVEKKGFVAAKLIETPFYRALVARRPESEPLS